jgi:hypothetical protein
MALVLKDRVRQPTTTTGTGTVSLSGSVPGFQDFSAIGDGNTTYYAIVLGTEWEVGIGTYTASGDTLSRDTVLDSSNSGSLVDFSAGTKDVFVTNPALIALGNIGNVNPSVTAAGADQTTATGLITGVNNVTTVAAGDDGVRLPVVIPGMRITVRNSDAADTLKIYPASGAEINDLGVDVAYELLPGGAIEFFAISTTQWYSFGATGWGGV